MIRGYIYVTATYWFTYYLNRRNYVLLKINTVTLKLAKQSTVKSCDAVLRIILIYVRNFEFLKYIFFYFGFSISFGERTRSNKVCSDTAQYILSASTR